VKKEHPKFNLISRTKAESDPVVAAASIVARATYVREMKALSIQAEMELGKGAGKEVLKQATQIFENEGVDGLEQTAKMHFKTVYEAQGLKPPEKAKFVKK
jgi:ribonuclease HIII